MSKSTLESLIGATAYDERGDKIGKVHVGKQDFKSMQTRKMKGLKRGRTPEQDTSMADADTDDVSADGDTSATPKRTKV